MKTRELTLGEWPAMAQKLQVRLCSDTKVIVCERDKQIVAAVALDNWSSNSAQIHVWCSTPMVWRHGFHEEIFRYFFEETGREVLIGLVPADNSQALKLDLHFGFQESYRIKDGYDKGVDYIILQMRRTDYEREYKRSAGQRAETSTAA